MPKVPGTTSSRNKTTLSPSKTDNTSRRAVLDVMEWLREKRVSQTIPKRDRHFPTRRGMRPRK